VNVIRRLSIWQRIWAVVSAGSLICIAGTAIVLGPDGYEINPDVSSGFANHQCRLIVDMPAGGKLAPEPRPGNPCWALYAYRSSYDDARTTNLGYVEHMNSLRWSAFRRDATIAFVAWIVAVSLLYGVGQMVAWVRTGQAKLLLGVGAVISVWFAAFAVESATRLMVRMFSSFGADLPGPSLLTISAVQSYVPWILAAAFTLIILYLGIRGSNYFLHACIVVAAAAAVLTSFVAVSLVLPIMKCGFEWPEWPASFVQSPPPSQGAPNLALGTDTPRRALAGECR
jgi:hypothetical protein